MGALERNIVIVTGQTGQGKTTFAKQYIASMYDRIFAIDPMEQYPVDYMRFDQVVEKFPNAENSPKVFKLGVSDIKCFSGMCKLAYAVGDCCLLIEETDLFDQKDDAFLNLVFRGRHKKVSLVAVSQRPFRLSINLRSQANRLVAFKQIEPNDLKWLKEITSKAVIVKSLRRMNSGSIYFNWDALDGASLWYIDFATGATEQYHVTLPGDENEDVLGNLFAKPGGFK